MAGIQHSSEDLLGDDEDDKQIRIVSDGQMGEMTYVITHPGDLDQEEGITLDNITEAATNAELQIATSESGAVQIVTSAGEDGSFITSDGHIISQNDDNELIINTEDGQQVFLQESSIVDGPMGDSVHSLDIHPDERLTQIEDIGLEQQTIVDENQEEQQYQNLIIQHMDISEPLTTLRKLLQQRLGTSLNNHDFYLQDVIPLEPTKNLTSQCVQGSGMVQINVEVKSQPGLKPRLNIVDILKPAEELIEMQPSPQPAAVAAASIPATQKVVIPFPEESENVTRWIVDQNYRRDQEKLKIPFDPVQWEVSHVRHWITWAVKEFNLKNVNINHFNMTGRQLCELKHEHFVRYIPSDKGDIFWTHLELLRKCKFVATIQQPTPHAITTITVSSSDPQFAGKIKSLHQPKAKPRTVSVPHTQRITSGNRTGNNGQIQLWQFLLELLTDKDYLDIIHWVGEEGEFKLNNPEVVAQLWGQRKNKPTMNYEKLSRALRYYYDGDMIAKVHGKRFVYKFVCDLRMLLGYAAADLRQLVCECGQRNLIVPDSVQKRVMHSRPIILQNK